MNFQKKKVLIMGLGLQGGGLGATKFFVEQGAKVTVTDLKTEKELDKSLRVLKSLGKQISFVLGGHREEDFKNADLILRNPDVRRDSPYLKIAGENKIPVEMEESLFLKLCPNLENVIGITGTRGKTTTTHLVGEILKKAGFQTFLGGNLRGVSSLSLLDQITPEAKVVLELSSWQLQGLGNDKISPHIAVLTNLYEDHLNRYKNMKEYINDKKNIYRFQNRDDYFVLNKRIPTLHRDDAVTEAKAKVIWFSVEDVPLEIRKNFSLPGEHNLENLAAAYRVAKILGIPDKIILKAVKNFEGVPFRLQKIAQIDGVTYVNDTTSTTPIATIAALKTYKAVILICGGASKNLDTTEMVKEIIKRVKAVVLLEGSGTEELKSKIKSKVKILGPFNNLETTMGQARNLTEEGDIILLSPGFASFGMFTNEFERGERFNEIVKSFSSSAAKKD